MLGGLSVREQVCVCVCTYECVRVSVRVSFLAPLQADCLTAASVIAHVSPLLKT